MARIVLKPTRRLTRFEMVSKKETCAFVVLTYNSGVFLENCLLSIMKLDCVDPYIYACDNGSTDDTARVLNSMSERFPSRLSTIFNDKNEGTTKPRNDCIKAAIKSGRVFKYLIILDSDTIINSDAMSKMFAALESDPSIGIVAPRMFNDRGVEQMSVKKAPSLRTKFLKAFPSKAANSRGLAREKYEFFPGKDLTTTPPNGYVPLNGKLPSLKFSRDNSVYFGDYAISACWVMRMELIKKVGLLDEKYFYAPEDADYCACLYEHGLKVALVSGASIFHLTQRLSKRKFFSKINLVHIFGLIRYAFKHANKPSTLSKK